MFREPLRLAYHGMNASSPVVVQKKAISNLLRDYDTPGVFPPSARIDRTLKVQDNFRIKLWDAWKYPAFAVNKASSLARDILFHHILGPRRKTWGIEMTIITSLMRDVSRHSALADIAMVRMAMGIAGLVPLPSDALVTPVTFRVRSRNLPGILSKLDSKEKGDRELSGEWIVGKNLWQKLQSEYRTARKSNVSELEDPTAALHYSSTRKSRVILYVHGGAYYSSSAAAQRMLTIPLSKYTDSRVFAIDYRLAPETCFPGPLHDVVSAYLRLIDDLHLPPENIIVAGDSAGGGLCLALLLYLRDHGYSLPSGGILFSPWVDLTLSCPSWDRNAPFDIVPTPGPGAHLHPVVMYLGDGLEEYLTHPYASPLFGSYEGLPPMLIQCGDAEVLVDEIVLLAHKASLAGVHVKHETYQDAIHVFQSFPFLTATNEAFLSCREFVRHALPKLQAHFPRILSDDLEARLDDEIANDNVCVVRGDGVETVSGRNEVNEHMKDEDENFDDEDHSSHEELPSWGRRSAERTLSPELSDSEPALLMGHTPSVAATSNPPLSRIKSAISTLVSDASPAMWSDGSGFNLRPSTLTKTPMMTRPSSPFTHKNNSGHSSITPLVEQWSNSLPPTNCSIAPKAQVSTHPL
ncbi:Alpha/Beta hydrolase protein [Hygrophoropsis aurantiaca]|uniref:Alpha/Beta hydrolase protein n=1 Tax=Hygrophoropsis aurantiaca TaxID=72124 RepID=A0ACB8AP02_9AGAM|nr:Alpha/Beta hydrolase protein [Hygrophoropsis aurantiaca]